MKMRELLEELDRVTAERDGLNAKLAHVETEYAEASRVVSILEDECDALRRKLKQVRLGIIR